MVLPCLVSSGLIYLRKTTRLVLLIPTPQHHVVNFFGYRTTKDEVKDGKCMASAGGCNGLHSEVKHDFSLGSVFRLHDFTIWRNSLATMFPGLDSPRLFPAEVSEV
jgi:hypothetical protein